MRQLGAPNYKDRFFSNIPLIGACFTIGVGVAVSLGWLINLDILLTLFPGLASMKFETALSFLLCGVYLLAVDQGWQSKSLAWYVVPWIVLFIALMTLVAYQLDLPLFLDELIVPDPYTPSNEYPGRMSAGTAFNFLLIAVALILWDKPSKLVEGFVIAAHLIALAAVQGYIFDVGALYDVSFFSTMAIHTAVAFIILSIGIIFALPNGRIASLVAQKDPSGSAIRYMMPAALIIPLGSAWLVWEGYLLGLYDIGFGIVLLTMITVTILAAMAIAYALNARRWYTHNEQIQNELLVSQIALVEADQEREMIEIRERFLAMLSHDMRNPVTGIIMSSDILLNYQERLDADKKMKHLARIRYQANNIKDLVEDIMLVNQLNQNDFPFEPTKGEIVAFCRKLFGDFADMESEKPHEFVGAFPDSPVYMHFDPRLLMRLSINLLRNAVKYSPNGGTITFSLSVGVDSVELKFSDQGIGIPSEHKKKLFQLFSRANNVGSIPGYGLGLAIVNQIVQAHQGRIEVESEQGRGTEFNIILPLEMDFSRQMQAIDDVPTVTFPVANPLSDLSLVFE